MRSMKPKKGHPWIKSFTAEAKKTKKPKTCRVFVTLEIETAAPLAQLRVAKNWLLFDELNEATSADVLQVQVNAAKEIK